MMAGGSEGPYPTPEEKGYLTVFVNGRIVSRLLVDGLSLGTTSH